MPSAIPDYPPSVRLEGERARPFLVCDPGERVTLEIEGTVRRIGLDRRLLEAMPGSSKREKRERPEVEVEVNTARLIKAGKKRS